MRPVRVLLAGTGTSSPVAMDKYISPFNVSLGLITGGTGDYTVQHTFDDYFNPPAGGAVWFNHSFLVNIGPNSDGNYTFPVSAIRLVCAAAGPSGTGTLVISEAGIGGA